MITRQKFYQASTVDSRDELDMTRVWETDDQIDFLAEVVLGAALAALVLSVI